MLEANSYRKASVGPVYVLLHFHSHWLDEATLGAIRKLSMHPVRSYLKTPLSSIYCSHQ